MASGDLTVGLLDEGIIGVLVIVLVVLLSTGYVYLQQMQAPGGGAANNANARNNAQFPPGTRGGHQNAMALAPNAVATASLTDQQLRLHRSLPSRHGARTITICTDALLQNKESELIAWTSEDVPTVLADLLQIADVYLLCVVRDEKNKAAIERIRAFVTSGAGAYDDKTKRGLKTHKILFCTTTIGKIAFVRQIEPQFHVEVDKSAVRDLEKHVPRIVHVTASPQENAPLAGSSAHHVADSFSGYFKLLSALAGP